MREKVPRGPSAGEQPAGGRVEGGAAISGSSWGWGGEEGSGAEEGSTGEMEGAMATDWRPRTCTRSASEPTVRAAPTG